MKSVALAYAGVHQIFQLALAAHERGELEGLFCSLVDGPGKWGRRLGKLVPAGTGCPLGANSIPPELMTELPWPLLANRLGRKLLPFRQSDHLHSNVWFDRRAARWLRGSKARVFVGGESCALASMRQAADLGMTCVLDCAGVPSEVLDAEARQAALDFGVEIATSSNSEAMLERKRQEIMMADVILCCSQYQRDKLVSLHPVVKRTEVLPLWTDVDFWSQAAAGREFSAPGRPLRVLCAGAVSLRKGIPYLLQAVEPLGSEITLTLVGRLSAEMETVMPRFRQHRHLPYVPKQALRELYREHDVVVMPTLGDSFGFVTVEAMASGMPVIVSQSAGAPVPDESWRVPARDAPALRGRLELYLRDRDLLRQHANVAAEFGRQFRPENYRARAGQMFTELLAS